MILVRQSSGWVARRALTAVVSVMTGLVGVVVTAPTAPAAPAVSTISATTTARSVTVGTSHSCALTATGGVRCWGYNGNGQLGDGSLTDRTSPVDVRGLTSGVTQVSAGAYTTCAVTDVGGVKCWGYGTAGQLGNADAADSSTPVDVVGLSSGVASVSVGYGTVCAVTTSGGVKCWGDGAYGALGTGATESSAVPVDVVGLGSGVRAVSTGWYAACAVTATGVSCWGDNTWGQLGIGRRPSGSSTPVAVGGLGAAGVTSISAGSHSACATTGTGQVRCWGMNYGGWLGVGSSAGIVWQPMRVTGIAAVTALEARGDGSCAVGRRLTWCWGFNGYGALGDGTTTSRATPAPVIALPGPVAVVATGGYHACAVTTAGLVLCWGGNANGQLGDGTTTDSLTPVPVAVRL